MGAQDLPRRHEPALRAFLRVFDLGTSTCTELGVANVTVSTNANQAWTEHDPTRSFAGVAVPGPPANRDQARDDRRHPNVEIAYDTPGTRAR